jgi:hypothetical protein
MISLRIDMIHYIDVQSWFELIQPLFNIKYHFKSVYYLLPIKLLATLIYYSKIK